MTSSAATKVTIFLLPSSTLNITGGGSAWARPC
jgi:hypothetical protein